MSIHVYPVADEHEHVTTGLCCWCEPDVYFFDQLTGKAFDEPLVVHNAADCRELIEQAEHIKRQASVPIPPLLLKRTLPQRVCRVPRVFLAHWRICRNVRVALALTWRALFF